MDDGISVFGATGFIGSHFCTMYPNLAVPIKRDSRVPETKDILYLISTTTNYNVFDDLHKDIDTNLSVLVDVLSNLTKENVFNFVSSWLVYGDAELPARETSPCNPKGFYSITKRCAEQLIISFCKTFGFKYRIFRLAGVYGIGDRDVSAKKNALLYLIQKLTLNEDIGLYYGGDFIRDFIHVKDVCRAMLFCIQEAPVNEIINIGSGIPYRFGDLIYYAKGSARSRSKIVEISPPEFHYVVQTKDFYLDVSKLRSLGFDLDDSISIYDGIDEFIDFCKRSK